MTPRPVLFVDHASVLGGAERSLLLILGRLDSERWQPHVAGTPGQLLDKAAGLGVKTHEVPLPRLRRSARSPFDLLRGARALMQVARRTGATVLVANTVRAAIYTAVATTFSRIPFLWHMRDFWLSESRPAYPFLDQLGKRLLVGRATVVVTNSAAVAEQLPRSADIRVVHNGIDVSHFSPAPLGNAFRQKYDIHGQRQLVGMIGRLRPWKGQLRFLEVAQQVRKAAPQTRFVIVGGDPFAVSDGYAAAVAQKREALRLEEIVTFTGHLADVRPALSAMDIFVHPGDPEPFGLVNIEAMAMGRPVVAFAHGALPEIVVDGASGRLIRPGDVRAMAQCILQLLADPSARAKMGNSARELAVEQFSIERTTREIESILRHVTEQTP